MVSIGSGEEIMRASLWWRSGPEATSETSELFMDSHLLNNFFSPVAGQDWCLQHTHLAVLFTAGDVVDLPFQRPALDTPDHFHDLKPTFCQRVLSSDRECGCVNDPCENPFIFEFFQPLRENFWRNTV